MPQFATIEDYYEFRGLAYDESTLTEAEELAMNAGLRRASQRVANRLRLARYARASDGLPVSLNQRRALIEATAATLDYIRASGDDFTGAGSETDWSTIELIGVKFSKSAGAGGASGSAAQYAEEADGILTAAGFFTTHVRHPGR